MTCPHFLFARIYEAQGDTAVATAHLRQFLKFNNDRKQSDAAKQYLGKLESQQSAK